MEITVQAGQATPIKCFPTELASAEAIKNALALIGIQTSIEMDTAPEANVLSVVSMADSIFADIQNSTPISLSPEEKAHVDKWQTKAKEFADLIVLGMGRMASQNPSWINGNITYAIAADQVTATLVASNITPKVELAVMGKDGFVEPGIGEAIAALRLFNYEIPNCLTNINFAHGKTDAELEGLYQLQSLVQAPPAPSIPEDVLQTAAPLQ